jgi:NADPH-dependent 2,4-dienoyl-CoA reductase/sulfur reductase-like enzyme
VTASTHYLLIGGGLASSQAAKQLRLRRPDASITLVGEEPHVPYDRPPLSKEFLRGEKPTAALFFDPEQYFHDQRIELVLGHAVQQLDVSRKRAIFTNGRTIEYGRALLATGGRPVHLNIPGANLPGVQYLRTVDDAEAIAKRAVKDSRAVVVGAGFIGVEVAASLTQRGVRVTVIEAQPHIWPRFADRTLAGIIQSHSARHGIVFRTGEQVAEIRGDQRVESIVLESGDRLPCDFVCVGIGIVPNVEPARHAGLAVDNGIVVNEYLQSSDPDVYAAGDVANYFDPVFGKRRRVEHWGHAEYTGQLAGQNMAGERRPYDLLTYVWSDVFAWHLEFAGDESEHDQILIRGNLGDAPFIVLYLKQHILTAYFAINAASKDFPPLQRLIRSKRPIVGKEAQLQDPTVPLKSLLS